MISIGIIGAGIVGERIIKQIQQENGVEIIGVFDENSERLQTLKQMYDVPLAATHHLRNALNHCKEDHRSVLEKYEIPIVASVLKLYLLELPGKWVVLEASKT